MVMKKKGLFDWLIDSMAYVAGLLLVAAVLIVSLEICMRYFFEKPQIWTVEVCEFILFILAFLGAPWLLKKGGHASVDILVERMSPVPKRYASLFASAVGMFISVVLVWFGLVTTWQCYTDGVVLTKTLTVSKYYFLLFIVLGYFCLLIEFGRQFLRLLRKEAS
jgi:TRAP-type C4-dicarboxylate transport system permease small subunit